MLPRIAAALCLLLIVYPGPLAARGAVEGNKQAAEETAVQPEAEQGQPAAPIVSFRDIAQKIVPVVVLVAADEVFTHTVPDSRDPGRAEEEEFRRSGLGSGIIVSRRSATYFVVTNNHVIGSANEISVTLNGGRVIPAELVGRDPRKDLALLSFESGEPLPVAELGDSDALAVGDWVMAVGAPMGLESSVTTGIVSALGRRGGPGNNISDFIQTDAAINPGNSGGALVDITGRIIGINTWIASTTGSFMGFGFAIPVKTAKRAIDDIIAGGRAAYAWLGVGGRDLDPAEYLDLRAGGLKGVLAANLYLDSPAALAGLMPGDIITHLGSRPVFSAAHFIQLVGDEAVGSLVDLQLLRRGEALLLPAKLSERAPDADLLAALKDFWPGLIAVRTEYMDEESLEWRSGCEVVEVYMGTAADSAGLEAGDIITAVYDRSTATLSSFYQELAESGKTEFALTVLRGGETATINLARPKEQTRQ